MKAGQLEA